MPAWGILACFCGCGLGQCSVQEKNEHTAHVLMSQLVGPAVCSEWFLCCGRSWGLRNGAVNTHQSFFLRVKLCFCKCAASMLAMRMASSCLWAVLFCCLLYHGVLYGESAMVMRCILFAGGALQLTSVPMRESFDLNSVGVLVAGLFRYLLATYMLLCLCRLQPIKAFV